MQENLMNTKKTILFITLALMLLASSACGSATETADPNQVNAVNTGIAETAQSAVNATLTRIALSNPYPHTCLHRNNDPDCNDSVYRHLQQTYDQRKQDNQLPAGT